MASKMDIQDRLVKILEIMDKDAGRCPDLIEKARCLIRGALNDSEYRAVYKVLSKAYTASAYYLACRMKMEGKPVEIPEIIVEEDSLPKEIELHLASEILKYLEIGLEVVSNAAIISTGMEQYLEYLKLNVVAVLAEYKKQIEEALEIIDKILRVEAKRKLYGVDLMVGTPVKVKGEPGDVEISLFRAKLFGVSRERQEQILRMLREHNFTIQRYEHKDFYTDIGVKWFDNAVVLYVDVDSENHVIVDLFMVTKLPRIRLGEKIGNVNIKIRRTIRPEAKPQIRKVQVIGGKLALYLTEALQAIGVGAGDLVQVDVVGDRVIIRKAEP